MNTEKKPTLYRKAGFPFTATDRQRLTIRGVTELYIDRESINDYRKYLSEFVNDPAILYDLQPDQRASVFTEWLRLELQHHFSHTDPNGSATVANRLAGEANRFLNHPHFSLPHLMRALRHDNEPWTHWTNVGLYVGLLAKSFENTPEDSASIIAGGFLHDFGKIQITKELSNRQKCSVEETAKAMHAHPTMGIRNLSRSKELTAGQLLMVYQHHERPDRTGYPVRIPNEEIHFWAKLCSVANTFDGLTSASQNRPAMTATRAISAMKLEIDRAFDAEILECWTDTIQPYLRS
jgi:HD-GYP domain-containing protein (c-di-GMP phosphodiesterase class II)